MTRSKLGAAFSAPSGLTADRRLALHAVELLYLVALASVLATAWLALVLAELGAFSIWLLALLLSIVAMAGVVIVRWRLPRVGIYWSRDVAGLVPVVVLAAILFTPPFEYTRGALDPGTYVNTAASIVRSGSVTYSDHEMAALSDESRSALFRENHYLFFLGERLPGFYIVDMEQSIVTPHAFHMYPALLAVAFAVGGTWAALWVLPALAVLGVIGFALLVRRLIGIEVAVMAALLLIMNPGVIWFARYPAAEILVQVLVFGGLFALVIAMDARSRTAALLAGLALGAVHLTKIELVVLPAALSGFMAITWLRGSLRTEHIILISAYAVMTAHAVLHAYLFSTWYAYNSFAMYLTPTLALTAAASSGLMLAAMTWGRKAAATMLGNHSWRTALTNSGALAVLLAGALAYYVRPRLSLPPHITAFGDGQTIYEHMSNASFVTLGWYTAPLGLFLGVTGYAAALIRHLNARTLLLLMLVLLEVVFCLYEGRITPVHFWAARRYLPIVFPAFALFAAVLLWELHQALRHHWPLRTIPVLLGLVLIVSVFGGWIPFLGHTEYRGQVSQVEQMAAVIPESSIVLFDDSDLGLRYSVPMEFLHDRSSFVLWQSAADAGVARTLLDDWTRQNRQVYAVRTDRNLWALPLGYREEVIGSGVIDVPEVVVTTDTRPTTVGQFRSEYIITRIEPTTDPGRDSETPDGR